MYCSLSYTIFIYFAVDYERIGLETCGRCGQVSSFDSIEFLIHVNKEVTKSEIISDKTGRKKRQNLKGDNFFKMFWWFKLSEKVSAVCLTIYFECCTKSLLLNRLTSEPLPISRRNKDNFTDSFPLSSQLAKFTWYVMFTQIAYHVQLCIQNVNLQRHDLEVVRELVADKLAQACLKIR